MSRLADQPTAAVPADVLGSLPDVDPTWSRTLDVPDADGVVRRWHVLDTHAPGRATDAPVHGTVLCVHGNPTWSFLWRRFLAAAPEGWRVVAVDQLGMGYSERLAEPRRLAQRIADLGTLTDVLGVDGPVVTLAHDWGGPVSLGWALAHRAQVVGIVLTNTGVDLPVDDDLPALIRLARNPALRQLVCTTTSTFVRGGAALSRPGLPPAVRRALVLPYDHPGRRQSVADFVADIPLEADHPSRPAWDAMVAGVSTLADVPALLAWGPRDPVFGDRFLHDLLQRLPDADVQRYPRASHLVTEDAPQSAGDVWRWVESRVRPTLAGSAPAAAAAPRPPLHPDDLPWAALLRRRNDEATAVAEVHDGVTSRTSFAELERRTRDVAAGLAASGVRPGERVALLVPPGLDLTVAVYAVWRVGAAIVVADAGLGLRGMAHALRSAAPDHVIGIPKALVALAALGVPGRRIAVGGSPRAARTFGWVGELSALEQLGRDRELPDLSLEDVEGAVLFTSGATGPAKGVVYRMSQLHAQVGLVARVLRLGADDRLVAAFAPFALYGPAIGIGAVVPDMNVTSPGTLTARALADAVLAIDATSVFASPAALRNVVATAGELDARRRDALRGVRTLLSAGAPVPVRLLRQVQQVLPNAELHTPYGMTEVLPATDISLAQIEAAGTGDGVCVGEPLPGVQIRLSPLDELGRADGELTDAPGVRGEICIAAAHKKDRYDRLWATEAQSSRNPGWHRSGDIGHLDAEGRLWVEGRMVHVVATADGPVTPVGVEQQIEALSVVDAAAVAGVGPVGTQQVVAVVVPADGRSTRRPLADPELAAAVRAASTVPLAAVLVVDALPVDIRHASKVDRSRLSHWAGRLLAGERPGKV